MIMYVNILIGFIGGIAAAALCCFVYRYLQKKKPSVELVASSGSGSLFSQPKEKGYTWQFKLCIQNRNNIEYKITDIFWTPIIKKLRKQIPEHQDGWQTLLFNDVQKRLPGEHESLLVLKPYEYLELEAHWNGYFPADPRSKEAKSYWERYPDKYQLFESIVACLLKQKVLFQLKFADGKKAVFKGK
jgi:hypothetical protein